MRAVILLLLAVLAACRTVSEPARPDRLRVAVSVPPQAYFVERIGGDRVNVTVMIPPGYSEVDHPLTPRAVAALAEARLYIAVGQPSFDYERQYILPFLARSPGIRVVDMSRGVRPIEGGGHGHEGHSHAGGDPHVWVSPDLVRIAAVNIARALEEADPGHAAGYRANLDAFLAEIDRLDREIRARLADPSDHDGHRKFMVYHPSWGYFAREYGLEQIAIEAEGKEPSASRLIQLIDQARREGVRVIFVQGGFPRKSAQVIADAVGGRIVTADPLERDWAANLRRVAAALQEAIPHA